MFNPFKMWDEMLDIYAETVQGGKDEREIETVYMEFECPKQDTDELSALVANWLAEKGYNPEDFYAG